MTAPHVPRPRLGSDALRYWLSLASSMTVVVAVAVVGRLVGAPFTFSFTSAAIAYLVNWFIFCLTYAHLTWRALRRADGVTLAAWMAETSTQRLRREKFELMYGSGGPAGAVSMSAVTLGVVMIAAVVEELRANPVVVLLVVAVVASSWVLLVTVYAVHYAREQSRHEGLSFPHRADPRDDTVSAQPEFVDFVYLSVQVATTFATSDVSVRTSTMRRVVTAHSVIAFTYNTLIIAVLVSLLVSVS